MAEANSIVATSPEFFARLHNDVENGDATTIQGLLQTFTKEEAKDILNQCNAINPIPLLVVAIRGKHENIVRLLVDHYDVAVVVADITQDEITEDASVKEHSPILQSISVGSPIILDILCKKVQYINRWYPIHFVCEGSKPNARDTLLVLLRNGADVNLRDGKGLTPLLLACQSKNNDVIQILIQYRADVTLCSPDGNTVLHYLITQKEVSGALSLSTQEAVLQITKELSQHGMLQNQNGSGLTPLLLACLEGNDSMVEFLLDNISLNDRQRADSYELLASSILFSGGFVYENKKIIIDAHYFFHKAMLLRHLYMPPLYKSREQDPVQALLFKAETQNLAELDSIKTNADYLFIEALLARQRIIDKPQYNDHFLPLVCRYMFRQLGKGCVKHSIHLLMYVFKVQQLIPTNIHILEERMKMLDSICCKADFDGTFDIDVLAAILNSIEEFYKCDKSENISLSKTAYVRLADALCSIVTNAHTRNDETGDIQALTRRFLCLTMDSKDSNLQPSSSALRSDPCPCGLNIPIHYIRKLIRGDNLLHIACREVPSSYYDQKISNISNRGLSKLLKTLRACAENVNAQNSDGKTPLQVLLCDTRDMREFYLKRSLENFDLTHAVRCLLLAETNPNIRDKKGETSMHAAMIGYAYFFQCVPDYKYKVQSDVNMEEWNEIVTILLKSGADPNAKNVRGLTPLHVLMGDIFCGDTTYGIAVSNLGDRFAYRRQLLHDMVHTIQSFGGCAHASDNKGRTVFDICKEEELREKMGRNIQVTNVHLTLSRLAAAAVRRHQIRYHDMLPTRLIKFVEFYY